MTPARISWPVALVVVALLGAVTTLGALGKSVTELIALGTFILGAVLYGELRGMREGINGTTTRLVDGNNRMAATLGQSTPGYVAQQLIEGHTATVDSPNQTVDHGGQSTGERDTLA